MQSIEGLPFFPSPAVAAGVPPIVSMPVSRPMAPAPVASAGAAPQLILLKQNSPCVEKHTRKGIQRNVHVVVKNAPFTITLGMNNHPIFKQSLDFNKFSLESYLVYDTEDVSDEKKVDFVRKKPLRCKVNIAEHGDVANIECRLSVLTSQHEDMFFRINFLALDQRTGEPFRPILRITSSPIKVISKPEQFKKARKTRKKRTVNDMLMETISKIEEKQKEQQKVIELLLSERSTKAARPEEAPTRVEMASREEPKPMDVETDPLPSDDLLAMELAKATDTTAPADDFEKIFMKFMDAYQALPSDDKPQRIRKIIRKSTAHETERISELLDLFSAEGLQKSVGTEVSGVSCRCSGCPYKQELQSISEFAFATDFLGPSDTSL